MLASIRSRLMAHSAVWDEQKIQLKLNNKNSKAMSSLRHSSFSFLRLSVFSVVVVGRGSFVIISDTHP